MELAPMSQISRWQSTGNVYEYSGRMAIARGIVTSLILAWSCYCYYCGYNLGRRTLDLTQDDDSDANEYFVMRTGKKIHLYKDCHTLDKVKVQEMQSFAICRGRRLKELAKKKGA